jgi:hypothetical protein
VLLKRFNIVAAQVESVAAPVQRFKSIATQVVSAAQRFNIVAAQVESVPGSSPSSKVQKYCNPGGKCCSKVYYCCSPS